MMRILASGFMRRLDHLVGSVPQTSDWVHLLLMSLSSASNAPGVLLTFVAVGLEISTREGASLQFPLPSMKITFQDLNFFWSHRLQHRVSHLQSQSNSIL